MESKIVCNAAMKTFSIETLGAGQSKAGGQTARKNRFEVLDRLAGETVLSYLHPSGTILIGSHTLGMR